MLPVVDKVKDLGVIIDSHLTFGIHVDQIVARAFVRANLIHKCFISRDVKVLMRAFTVYVRPLLEYACCVWSPHHVGQIAQVESVQRRFTKRLPGYANLSYKERLLRLNIDSLEMRRLRQDLLFTYKIVFGIINDVACNFFTLANTVHEKNTRGHKYKIHVKYSRLDVRKYFFSQRVVRPWNCLPATAEHFSSIYVFKRFLKNVNLCQFVSIGF